MELFFKFQEGKTLMEKLKFRHLDEVFGMLFFEIRKIGGSVYVRMNFILQL